MTNAAPPLLPLKRVLTLVAVAATIATAFALDDAALAWCRSTQSGDLKSLAKFISRAADWPVLAVLSVLGILLARAFRHRRVILILSLMLAATVLAGAIVNPIRALTGRVRPNAREAKGWMGPWDGDRWVAGRHARSAFPSAHTTVIAAFVTPLIILGRRRWRGTGVLIAAVGWSRMYLGVHHLSDVVVGAAVGGACGWAIARTPAARMLGWKAASRLCGRSGVVPAWRKRRPDPAGKIPCGAPSAFALTAPRSAEIKAPRAALRTFPPPP